MFDQQTEHPQASVLRQRIKGGKGFLNIHMSRLLDMLKIVNPLSCLRP